MAFLLLLLLGQVSEAWAKRDITACPPHLVEAIQLETEISELKAAISKKFSIEPAGFCEESMRKAVEDKHANLETKVAALIKALAGSGRPHIHLERVYAKIKSEKKREPSSCHQTEDLRLIADALRWRLAYTKKISGAIRSFFSEAPTKKDPLTPDELAEKSLCVAACLQKFNYSGKEVNAASPCARGCEVTEDFLKRAPVPGASATLLSPACWNPQYGLPSQKDTRDLTRATEKVEKFWTDRLKSAWKKLEPLAEKEQAILSSRLTEVEKRLAASGEPRCSAEELQAKTEGAVISMAVPHAFAAGTSFKFSAGEKNYLATARHVITGGEDSYKAKIYPASLPGQPQQNTVTFPPEPGNYDLANDTVIQEVPKPEKSLSLAGSAEAPKEGQDFFVSGYPQVRGRKFSTYRCKFLGYGENLKGTMAYFLYCPAEGFLEGISGGPMQDSDGRVWGIASSHDAGSDVVAVSPLSQDETGKPVMGLQRTFISNACYGPLGSESPKRRCQIFPGSTEMPVPLPKR